MCNITVMALRRSFPKMVGENSPTIKMCLTSFHPPHPPVQVYNTRRRIKPIITYPFQIKCHASHF